MARKLKRTFYARRATLVAPELLGMHLVVAREDGSRQVGRIVEVEAYEGPHDLAAHSARSRRTERTQVMFGPPGHAYVYLIYGIYHCFNVVVAREGTPHAVLVRAVEPVFGVSLRTQGPGLLCKAFGIDRRSNGIDICGERLWIERPTQTQWRKPLIRKSPRIGIGYAGEWVNKPWRYFDADSLFVSKARR